MGSFGKQSGREDPGFKPEGTKHDASTEEDWDFYFSNVDDIIGSFYVDLGLIQVAPINDKPNLVWISVKMSDPREDGLSSNNEFEILITIEDRLREFICAKHNSVYAGRLTTDGRRDFYFYMGDTSLYEKTISDAMVVFPAYSFDYGIKVDTQWKQYLEFMYPNPRQFQGILNRRVIDILEKNGDLLTKARPVDHWIYFKNDNDRELFISKIKYLKFDIVSQEETTSRGELRYELRISRIDHIDNKSVEDYALKLWELAEECNGEYDGWETCVEKE